MSELSIYSWNVNGFRSVLKKGFIEWLEKRNPDILCLQEIRSEWNEIDSETRKIIENEYQITWHPCAVKKGYSGTALFVRRDIPMETNNIINIKEIDQEGRLIEGEWKNTVLISGYFPNASGGLKRLSYKRSFTRHVINRILHHQSRGRSIVLVGDLNVAPMPIDLYDPDGNSNNPGFTNEERIDFDSYLSSGLKDIHRLLNPSTPGIYTWWSNRTGARSRNAGWRIDIFLISDLLVDQVRRSVIHDKDMGSDHCPIELTLEV